MLADVAASQSLSVRAAGVATALTVQRPHGAVRYAPLDPAWIDEALATVLADLPVRAVKVGMLGSAAVARVVAQRLAALPADIPLVLDPVFVAGSGGSLADDQARAVLKSELLPRATLITPNVPEAEALTGREMRTPADLTAAAEQLRAAGGCWVLIKGGHLTGEPLDLLLGPDGCWTWRAERYTGGEVHGTGCALSMLVAAHLAGGAAVPAAVDRAIGAVRAAIETSWAPAPAGWRFLGPLVWPEPLVKEETA